MLSQSTTEMLNNITKVFEDENIRMAVAASGKAGLIAGACTMAGGLVAGHIGIALGGIAGTALNVYLSPEFKPVPQIIQNDLTEEQKNKLVLVVKEALQKVPETILVGGLLTANDTVKTAVIASVISFMQNQGMRSNIGCPKS